MVSRVLRIDVDRIGPGTNLIAELGAESIDLLELRFFLEKEFKVRMTVPEILKAADLLTAEAVARGLTVGVLASVIQERLASEGRG